MRLLIVTQAVDLHSLTLGFFHRWIEEFAKRVEQVSVICLYKGAHSLPEEVSVISLGKEKGVRSKIAYALTFIKAIWRTRNSYDAVFVHMNEEYCLLGGAVWRLLGKRVFLWRNHYAGTWRTRLAGMVANKVFYTSSYSYTASFPRSVQMPVGVDTARFTQSTEVRAPHSILFFSRFAQSKHPDVLVDALALLKEKGISFDASFYGSAAREDREYRTQVQKMASEKEINAAFYEGVPNEEAPRVFGTHTIYVNLGESGMYDKMLFEAVASGCLVLAVSDDWKELVGDQFWFDGTAHMLAERLEELLGVKDAAALQQHLQETAVEPNSLTRLIDRLVREMS